jgi:hypothetical protein
MPLLSFTRDKLVKHTFKISKSFMPRKSLVTFKLLRMCGQIRIGKGCEPQKHGIGNNMILAFVKCFFNKLNSSILPLDH